MRAGRGRPRDRANAGEGEQRDILRECLAGGRIARGAAIDDDDGLPVQGLHER